MTVHRRPFGSAQCLEMTSTSHGIFHTLHEDGSTQLEAVCATQAATMDVSYSAFSRYPRAVAGGDPSFSSVPPCGKFIPFIFISTKRFQRHQSTRVSLINFKLNGKCIRHSSDVLVRNWSLRFCDASFPPVRGDITFVQLQTVRERMIWIVNLIKNIHQEKIQPIFFSHGPSLQKKNL